MKLRLYYPCKPYSIFQAFGQCDAQVCDKYHQMGLKAHNGDDVACPSGTKLYAAHDGVVTYAGLDGANGTLLVIRSDKEYEYGTGTAYFKTLYAHLTPNGIVVKPGQTVTAGDFVAYSDNSGFSTGAHLHFGLKPVYPGENDWTWYNLEQNNGYLGAIDPSPYWTGLFAEDVPGKIASLKAQVALLMEKLAQLLKK